MDRVCSSPGISSGLSSQKPREKITSSRKSPNLPQKSKRYKKPRTCGRCDEPESLAIVNPLVSREPFNDVEREVGTPNFLDQRHENIVDGGPPRFSQLLAQNFASDQEAALDPNMPLPVNHAPPALNKLLPQSSPSNPLRAPVLSMTPRINEARTISMVGEPFQFQKGTSNSEDTIRAQIAVQDSTVRFLLIFFRVFSRVFRRSFFLSSQLDDSHQLPNIWTIPTPPPCRIVCWIQVFKVTSNWQIEIQRTSLLFGRGKKDMANMRKHEVHMQGTALIGL
ncbi:hypothetical protein Mapa_001668 [Marchantia paleacea]|nr:hypothetical protein Mapa_001668 [Marchantia paleacea]